VASAVDLSSNLGFRLIGIQRGSSTSLEPKSILQCDIDRRQER
jgi:hypothetical protein